MSLNTHASPLSDGIHTAFNDSHYSVYNQKLGLGNFAFVNSYDTPLKQSSKQFVEVDEEKYGKDSTIRGVLRKIGFSALYIYGCDSQGRVQGDRLPAGALLKDHDRLLAVGQYQDRLIRISHVCVDS